MFWRPKRELTLQSYIHSLTIFCHDVELSMYLAKLFHVDIPIFNIHATPSPIISNFVPIWTATRDRHIHPRPHLHRESMLMSF